MIRSVDLSLDYHMFNRDWARAQVFKFMKRSPTYSLPFKCWESPFDNFGTEDALLALETGRVLILPQLAFEPDLQNYSKIPQTVLSGARKNVSYDPQTGFISGMIQEADWSAEIMNLLTQFAKSADMFMRALLPRYETDLICARTSWRPAEIAGRHYSPRHDDRRLHVDAFPTRPTGGSRILRLFTNIDHGGSPRHWQVGEHFEDFAVKLLPHVRTQFPGESWLLKQFGLTKTTRTPYDTLMLGLHDKAKLNPQYQTSAPKADLILAPGTTWLCFTDSVLHAALSGRNVLEQTFLLPVSAMANPDLSPLRVLERLVGHRLT